VVGTRTFWNLDPNTVTIHSKESAAGTPSPSGKCDIGTIPLKPQPHGYSSVIAEWDSVRCELVVYHVTFRHDAKSPPLRADTTVVLTSNR
jgi:hypothetical protein